MPVSQWLILFLWKLKKHRNGGTNFPGEPRPGPVAASSFQPSFPTSPLSFRVGVGGGDPPKHPRWSPPRPPGQRCRLQLLERHMDSLTSSPKVTPPDTWPCHTASCPSCPPGTSNPPKYRPESTRPVGSQGTGFPRPLPLKSLPPSGMSFIHGHLVKEN